MASVIVQNLLAVFILIVCLFSEYIGSNIPFLIYKYFPHQMLLSFSDISAAQLLGSNPCTWGPSYWCADPSNAIKCGAGVG